ncbi:ATP-grasp domain-containing protein [Singulisphaera sp. Ch08]|uniref:ATP-grasp domain-containing protein n=1 Tax=Singulisphaera sp. Ch08 TaxID=3120278 RepID=A0AAU7CL07_9BACT
MTDDFNILFVCAGRRVALIRLFRRALETLGLRGKLLTADLQGAASAHFAGDGPEYIPRISDPHFIDRLKEICRRRQVRLVVPLIDTVLGTLADHRDEFQAFGTTLLVSSPEVAGLCLDKRVTYEFFRRKGIPTPAILDPQAILADPRADYPFLLKPATGSSSQGVTRIENARQLEFFLDYIKNPIVQELITGQEYTLDILADAQGKVRCVVPRLRIETRAGEISKGLTVKNETLIDAGRRVVEALPGAVGCITVQGFLTPSGEIKFIEINPRFGGGFPLSAEAGADFPRWIIEMELGRDPAIALDAWRDGVVMLRYDDAIYTNPECLCDDFWSSTSTTPSTPSDRSS